MNNQDIIWSVSLIPYHKDLGYLMCEEVRKDKFTNITSTQTHPLGGKVEKSDRDTLYSAIREFVEESKIDIILEKERIKANNFNSIYDDIESMLSYKYYDIIVGKNITYDEIKKRKYVQNKIHRFYIWDITYLYGKIIIDIINLPYMYNYLNKNIKDNVLSIFWVTYNNLFYIQNKSSLVDKFLLL